MANPIVIDISHYQPTPNWEKVRDGGTVGVILKCTEGTSYLDPTYASRETAARNAGLCVSTYHFMRPGNIEKQMQWYLQNCAPATGERLCLDYEDAAIPFADLEKAAQFLLDYTGCEITVYGSNVLVDACKGKTSKVLEKTSLWQARYSSSEPKVPTNIWPTWSLWQYTDAAICDGISVKVDGNRWNGDPADLPGWFDRDALKPPPPVQAPATVAITVQGEALVTINGKVVYP